MIYSYKDFKKYFALINPKALILRNIALVVLNSSLIAISAHISVPLPWVPITLQSFTIILISLLYKRQIAVSSILVYIFEGAFNIPVFSNGCFGIMHLLGPSGGYLIGYIPMVYLISSFKKTSFISSFLVVILGTSFMYIVGLIQLSFFVPKTMVLMTGLYGFIFFDIVKALAAIIIANSLKNR